MNCPTDSGERTVSGSPAPGPCGSASPGCPIRCAKSGCETGSMRGEGSEGSPTQRPGRSS